MKAERHYLILAVLLGLFCIPAIGEIEVPEHEQRGLLGQPNPALAGIKALYVIVEPPDSEPNYRTSLWKELDEKVEQKLKAVGLEVLPKSFSKGRMIVYTSLDAPAVKIAIDMLKLDDSQRYVFHIQTSLARTMILPHQQNLRLKPDIWKVKPVMKLVSADNVPAKVTETVLDQTEAFISCYLVANPNDVEPSDANGISAMPKEAVGLLAKPATAKYKYVASKKSKVFHRTDCSWAKRISPKNLVGYDSRAKAIKAGKRPCKLCKP